MSDWTPDQLDRIDAAEELGIATPRPDGSLGAWVLIWVVRVDDDLYVRSYRGVDGAWFGRATASGRARIRAGEVERDVVVEEPAEPSEHERIDDAYRRKYGRYGAGYLTQMTSPVATAATVRLVPA